MLKYDILLIILFTHIKMENVAEMYVEEVNPVNEVKGFTKSFIKRSKSKKTEDINVRDLLNYVKENKISIGAKITEKHFKKNNVDKVYVASNCDVLTLKKFNHYANLANVEVIQLDLDNIELSQKLGKPFLISTVVVRKQ